MISTLVLRHLVINKIKDAEVLFKNGRYSASLYIAGYAVEIALKNKICRALQFNLGFPETRQELYNYLQVINRNNPAPLYINIGQIKNHNLPVLLFYSGSEVRIQSGFYNEWTIIQNWNPEDRYRRVRVSRVKNLEYLNAVKKIIKEIS